MKKNKISDLCFRTQILEELTTELLKNGFRVFGFQDKISQIFFENKDGIGTTHCNECNGLQFATTHKPSRENGTGFGLVWKNESVLEMAELACKTTNENFKPTKKVEKWKSFEEKAQNYGLSYFEITL